MVEIKVVYISLNLDCRAPKKQRRFAASGDDKHLTALELELQPPIK